MTTSDSESLHSRADALTGLVCSFETRGTGVRNWQSPVCKAAGPPLLCNLQLCDWPQATEWQFHPHWPPKLLHNPVWQLWSSETWAANAAEEEGTSQAQVFPVKIPQAGVGIRDGDQGWVLGA